MHSVISFVGYWNTITIIVIEITDDDEYYALLCETLKCEHWQGYWKSKNELYTVYIALSYNMYVCFHVFIIMIQNHCP